MNQALLYEIAWVKKEFVNAATIEKLRARRCELGKELDETEKKLKDIESFDAVAEEFANTMVAALGDNLTPELLSLNLRVKLGAKSPIEKPAKSRARTSKSVLTPDVLRVMTFEPMRMGDIAKELTKFGSELTYSKIRSMLKPLIADGKVRVQGTSKKNTTYSLVAA